MKSLLLYKFATWSLILLNVTLIAFFLMTRPPAAQPRGGQFLDRAIELLHLEDAQQTTFVAAARQHSEQMNALNQQQQNLLRDYLESLTDTTLASNNTATLNEVISRERHKIEITYRHFQEIKSMLNPSQLPYFEVFMKEASEALLLDSKKEPRRPKDF